MPSLGELAGVSGVPSLSRGKAGAALPPQLCQPKPQCFQLLGSPEDHTTAHSSCCAQKQHLPRLLQWQDLRGQPGPLGSSMGGAIGIPLP